SLTKQDTAALPAPDLLGRDFTAARPGEKLVGDITYLPTAEGWLFLATVLDLHTREIVGYAMGDHMRTGLVCDAIELAWRRGLTQPESIFHSDRGSQYTATDFRTTLTRLQIRPSMGRVGSCFDNAAAESWFASMKTEIGTRTWATREQARRDVFAYISYYNHHRLHSTLGYRTPHEARTLYRHDQALAA
ncbi:MAG: IS3 family transposase, partial [bacterium]